MSVQTLSHQDKENTPTNEDHSRALMDAVQSLKNSVKPSNHNDQSLKPVKNTSNLNDPQLPK